jgi:ABC-type antimicrobial peptide transport system permease subunit
VTSDGSGGRETGAEEPRLGTGDPASALAVLGLGTLIAWQVRLRTREIGVRLALGATPQQVIGAIVSESVPVVAAGVVAGLAAALLLGRFLEALCSRWLRTIR